MHRVLVALLYMCVYATDPILWIVLCFTVFQKKNKKSWYYITAFISVYIVVLFKQLAAFMGWTNLTMGLIPVMIILIYTYSIVFFKGSVKKKTAVLSVMFIATSMIEYLAEFLCIQVIRVPLDSMMTYGWVNLFILTCIKAADVIIYIVLIMIMKRQRRFNYAKELAPIIVLSMVSLMPICYLFYDHMNEGKYEEWFIVLISIQIFFEIIVVLYVGFILYFKKDKELRDKETIDFIKAQLALYDNISNYTDTIKGIQDNLKAQLCAILLLLRQNEVGKAEEYIEELLPQLKEKDNVFKLENTILAVVIYEQKLRAEQKKINVALNIETKDIPLSPKDLNYIVSNMFEHAIEACEKISEQEKRKIYFEVLEKDGIVQIICKNSILDGKNLENTSGFLMNKMESAYQRYGIRRIHKMVEKNHGQVQIRFNQNECIVKALFRNALLYDWE